MLYALIRLLIDEIIHFIDISYKGLTVSVATNGKDATYNVDNVGTNAAVLTTFIAIQQLKPDIIINAGTAGGFQRNKAAIGDIFSFLLTYSLIHSFTHSLIHSFTNSLAIR